MKTTTFGKRIHVLIWALLLSAGASYATLSGTYTINAAAAASATNYTTVSAAVSDLMSGTRADGGPVNGPGVSGPVTLRIVQGSGPYTEQVTFGAIAGTSVTNYVRLTGGPGREVIDFTNTTTTDRHVVRLSGAKHVILDSLTLNNYGTTYGYGVWITANSDSNLVQNSLISVNNTSTSSNFAGITISGSTPTSTGDNGDYNTIYRNYVSGGYYGFSCNGVSTTNFAQNNHVIENEFTEFYYYGIRHYEQNGGIISGNTLHARNSGSTSGYGMYVYYNSNALIEKNRIYDVGQYGIYTYNNNTSGGSSVIRNNMIGGTMLNTSSPYGIYMTTGTNNVMVYHNSISLTAGNGRCIYNLSGSGNDIRNNALSILNSTTGYALYISSTTYVSNVDYNNYYAPGSSNFVYVGVAYTPGTYVGGGGYNTNSIDGDPNFNDPYGDLHVYAAQLFDQGDATVPVTDDYDGDVRPNPFSALPDIGADEYLPDSIDIMTTALYEPTDFLCPDSFQVVKVVVNNRGLNTISSIPVTVDINGAYTGSLSAVSTNPIALGESDTITVGTFSTWSGGSFHFRSYSTVPGDQSMENDTLDTDIQIKVTPVQPAVANATVCEGDSTQLVAVSAGTNYWYDQANGGTLIASGDTLNTGPLASSANYYVEARGMNSTSVTTTFSNNNSCGGGNMFDVYAYTDITIDSFDVHLQNTGSTSTVDVYYVPGGYSGNETNAGAWTLLGSTTVTSQGVGIPTRAVIGGLTIPAGQTYGIYVYNPNVVYTNLGTTFSNGDLDLTVGVGLCGLFSGTNNPRAWNGTLYYSAEGCPSQRTMVSVNVDAKPVVNLSDTSGCTMATLDAGAGPGNYTWSTGDSSQTLDVSLSGTYSVVVQNGVCTVSDSAMVTIHGLPTVNLGADVQLCDGLATLFDAGNAGSSYLWSTGDTSQSVNVSAAGDYSVVVTDVNGCEGSDTVSVSTLNSPSGSVSFNDATCPTIVFTGASTGGAATTLSWDFGDGNTGSGMSPSHTYTANGTYTVTFIQETDCGADTSSAEVIIDCLTGIEDPGSSAIRLYPNPARGQVTVAMVCPSAGEVTLSLTDLTGRQVYRSVRFAGAGEQRFELDLSGLSAGAYLVRVEASDLIWQGKLIRE